MTVLKRRLRALLSSFTPLSRLFAVAMTLKPRFACTSELSRGMGSVFSDKMVMSVSCTSARDARVQLLHAGDAAITHRLHERAGHEPLLEGPLESSRA